MTYTGWEIRGYQRELGKLWKQFVADPEVVGCLKAWEQYIKDHGRVGLWPFFTSESNQPGKGKTTSS